MRQKLREALTVGTGGIHIADGGSDGGRRHRLHRLRAKLEEAAARPGPMVRPVSTSSAIADS